MGGCLSTLFAFSFLIGFIWLLAENPILAIILAIILIILVMVFSDRVEEILEEHKNTNKAMDKINKIFGVVVILQLLLNTLHVATIMRLK